MNGNTVPSIDSLKQQVSEINDPVAKGNLLLEIATRYQGIDPKQFVNYLDQAAAIREFRRIPEKELNIRFMYGIAAEQSQKFNSAKEIFEEILKEQEPEITDSTMVANIFFKLGNMLRLEGQVDQATIHMNKSKDLYLAMKDSLRAASPDVALGVIYKTSGQYEKAIQYYHSAFKTYKAHKRHQSMATCIMNMANVRTRQKRFDDAIELYGEALEISKSVQPNEHMQAFIFGNISNLYSKQNQFQKALDYAYRSYDLRKEVARPEEKATILIGIANNLQNLNRYTEATKYADQALEIAQEADGMLEVKERSYELKYKINLSRNRPNAALDAVQQYLIYHDSIRSTELEKQALELNTKYETEKKEQEIALLNTEKKLAASQLAASRRQVYGLLIGLLIMGGLLSSIVKLYRKTQTQNNIITNALKEKDILLREIHHRVKNNMQFVSALLGLQTEHVKDEMVLSALQEGQDRVQSMALIHQNLYQDKNLTGVAINEYFVKLIRSLFDSYNIKPDRIKLELNIPELTLELDSVTPIGLVVNELVSNSLKYAFPNDKDGHIWVSLNENNDKLILSVADDGIGMTQAVKETLGTSFGYRLIKVFKDQLRADLTIDGSNGTNIRMDIKKYRKITKIPTDV